jgi:hypothetical protein
LKQKENNMNPLKIKLRKSSRVTLRNSVDDLLRSGKPAEAYLRTDQSYKTINFGENISEEADDADL